MVYLVILNKTKKPWNYNVFLLFDYYYVIGESIVTL